MKKGNVQCFFYFGDLNTNRKKLFEEALSFAKQGKVLYLLKSELNELPQLSQDMTLVNRHYMKMLNFLYVQNLESLIETISSLLDWQHIPSTIILDDLSEYCGKENLQNACGLISLLIDTAHSYSLSQKMPCRIIVSVTRHIVGDEYCNTLHDLYSTNHNS